MLSPLASGGPSWPWRPNLFKPGPLGAFGVALGERLGIWSQGTLHERSFCTVRYAHAFATRAMWRLVRAGMRRRAGAEGRGLTAKAGRREAKGERACSLPSSRLPVFPVYLPETHARPPGGGSGAQGVDQLIQLVRDGLELATPLQSLGSSRAPCQTWRMSTRRNSSDTS